MKSGALVFVRQLEEGAKGPDVRAVKRALRKAGFGKGTSDTPTLGATAATDMKAFQSAHHLTPDGVYGKATHAELAPFFDDYGAQLLAKEAVKLAKHGARDQYVQTLRWMLQHRSLFDYAEVRPIPVHLQPFETTTRIVTDCSGAVTLAASWTKLPDPNGLNFNGQGYTGTLLQHCTPIQRASVRPADLIVYGAAPGHHVVAVLDALGNGDFNTFSHGTQGDPREILHSAEQASQARNGHTTVTFLRFLP